MVINILDKYLPVELSDKIYKIYHRNIIRKINEIILYKTVFILTNNKLSFLICEGQNYINYYNCLYIDEFYESNNKTKVAVPNIDISL